VRSATEDELFGKRKMLPAGSGAPDWQLADAAQRSWSSRELKGKVMLLDFAATWCAPCKAAMPILESLDRKYRERGVQVLTVDVMEQGQATLAAHFQERGYAWPLLLNGDRVAKEFGVEILPALFVIDAEGRIVYTHAAYDTDLESQLAAILDRLLR
jgi:thiol-disulfide isomerase/thioredoxin